MVVAKKEVKIENPESKILENRKIKVTPIFRDKAFFKKDHDGNHTYTGCWKIWTLPVSTQTRTYINPFLSKDEQYAFEQVLGLDEDAMNPNRRDSKFWGEFNIRIDRTGLLLDLSLINDALTYRVLKVIPQFANEKDDINIPEFEYRMVDERYIEEESSKLGIKKAKAYEELFKISSDRKKMVDILRMLNIKLADDVKIETLKNKLISVIETQKTSGDIKIKTIDDFLTVVNDPQAIIKLFVFDAIDKGEVIVRNGEYRITENNELIGQSLQGAMDWFNDIRNKEIKALIEQRLKK